MSSQHADGIDLDRLLVNLTDRKVIVDGMARLSPSSRAMPSRQSRSALTYNVRTASVSFAALRSVATGSPFIVLRLVTPKIVPLPVARSNPRNHGPPLDPSARSQSVSPADMTELTFNVAGRATNTTFRILIG